jgi:hypothetical protein
MEMTRGSTPRQIGENRPIATIDRWECHCQESPVLLATYDDRGRINIKIRDRYWTVHEGVVRTHCPRCGAEHVLDLSGKKDENPDG